ncbi:MAG: hypothetical protein JWP87_5688 [Labilithrix sp.]|jgi:hypothetical protein|nr:hypothetical protein [Labilithrix sp.]
MRQRVPVAIVFACAATLLGTGCGVEQLPPVKPPAKLVPVDVDVPPDPPAPGTGRVILETDGEPAKVVEITGTATAWTGGYRATVIGLRPLCVTPCVVDLPYGSHPIVLRSMSDETHQSETEIEVGARAKVFRHTLGERKDGGALRTVGGSLLTLGILAAATGAVMWLAGNASSSGSSSLTANGQLVTGLGAGGVLLSIPFLVAGRPTERPGSTTQWNMPGAPPPPSSMTPAGAAVDRL